MGCSVAVGWKLIYLLLVPDHRNYKLMRVNDISHTPCVTPFNTSVEVISGSDWGHACLVSKVVLMFVMLCSYQLAVSTGENKFLDDGSRCLAGWRYLGVIVRWLYSLGDLNSEVVAYLR